MEVKGSQMSEVLETIKNMILAYELKPGDIVSDSALSVKLNVSRTPVREALIVLQHYGLVVSDGGKLRITKIDLEDIIEICQVREAVETQAVKIIINNGGLSKEQLQELTEMNTEHSMTARQADQSSFYNIGSTFHGKIVEFSGNKRLIEIIEKMRLQNMRAQWLNVLQPDVFTVSVDEHSTVIDGLAKLDVAKTIEAICDHESRTIARYKSILASSEMREAILQISESFK